MLIIPKDKLTKVDASITGIKPVIVSRGIGDTIEKILHPIVKGTKLENCKGCKNRKEILNKLFPYDNKQDKQSST
jgi:hypothetical protein